MKIFPVYCSCYKSLTAATNTIQLLEITIWKICKNNLRKLSTNLIRSAEVQSFQTLDNICVVVIQACWSQEYQGCHVTPIFLKQTTSQPGGGAKLYPLCTLLTPPHTHTHTLCVEIGFGATFPRNQFAILK